jgi:hypothetical protein
LPLVPGEAGFASVGIAAFSTGCSDSIVFQSQVSPVSAEKQPNKPKNGMLAPAIELLVLRRGIGVGELYPACATNGNRR